MFRRMYSSWNGKTMFYPKYGTSLYEYSPLPKTTFNLNPNCGKGGSEVNFNHPSIKMIEDDKPKKKTIKNTKPWGLDT